MQRKLTIVIGLLVLFSLVLSACQPAATAEPPKEEPQATAVVEPTKPPEPPAEVVKRKVVMFVGLGTGTDPDQLAPQEALVKRFNDTHPDIEVELLIVPHEESVERYLAMVAGGTAPEVIAAAGFATIAAFNETSLDMSEYMKRDNYNMDDYYPSVGQIMSGFFPGNVKIALPFGIYPSMVFYNKDLFDAAGLEYPTHDYTDSTWNFDKVREYGMKMTLDQNGNDANSADFDPTKIKQWGYDDSWANMINILSIWGAAGNGMVTTPDHKTAIVNQPEWVAGLQWLSDGIWKDHFIPDTAGQEAYYAVAGDPFGGGLVAMFLSHTWFFAEGLVDLPFAYDIAPVPSAPNGKKVVRSDIDGFAISKDADETDAAWEFLKWLISTENIIEVCDIYGCLPPLKTVEAEYRQVLAEKYPEMDLDVIYEGFNYLDNPHSDAWAPEYARINGEVDNAGSLVFSGENKDAQAVLDAANVGVQKILDEYWASH